MKSPVDLCAMIIHTDHTSPEHPAPPLVVNQMMFVSRVHSLVLVLPKGNPFPLISFTSFMSSTNDRTSDQAP